MAHHRISSFSLIIILGLLPLHSVLGLQSHQEEVQNRTFQLVEEVRIGDPDGAMEYVFGRVGVEPGKDGRFIVADPQVPVIRMYDAGGTFIKQVGREGRGPGEYNNIVSLQAFPDGSFAVSDSRNRRVNLYDPEGEPLGSHTVMNGLHSAHVFQVDRAGHFYVRRVDPRTRMTDNWSFFWEKYSPDGSKVDSIGVPRQPEPRGFVLVTPPGYAYPFIEKPHFHMSPLGYLVTGNNEDYTLSWDPPGGESVTVNRDYDPVAVKPGEHDQWIRFRNRFDLDMSIPHTKPAYKDFEIDMEGRIWVRRYVEAELTDAYSSAGSEQWWEPPTYDIFMPDGSFYGRVIMPWNTGWAEARGDKVWAVLEGENDVPYVVRYRME